MNIHRVLFFCFFSALCGGNTGLVSAKVNIYTGAEGETGTINCNVSLSGSRKFFCKNECKAEDILVKTDDVRAQSGRYSIEYRDGSSGRGIVSVTITNLTKSDSGRYRCGLGGTSVPESFSDFEVRVSDATGISGFLHTYTEGENVTLGCSDTVYGRQKFFCKGECKKEEDIIIDTDGNRAQSGRYSIKYEAGSVFGLYVSMSGDQVRHRTVQVWLRQSSVSRFIPQASDHGHRCSNHFKTNIDSTGLFNIRPISLYTNTDFSD
ncbi:polymeric immunoglobulin receptor-like isoform X1 [Micropterus salmoides]|uniref:polymeric immunoglobulin receptor-like isoform X1 n=1 Tax=Micropterus salmoides TaxID=27706 RepID=UPI0018EDCCBF|nr:polymeric immunoglobulin receptor-like isoform X1 [Micropterus salmoides]